MEILRTVGEKMEKWGRNLLIISIVKDLGITKQPINKIGKNKLMQEYDQYFENLMDKSPNELQVYINEKLKKIPEERRTLAREIIYRGMRRHLAKTAGEKSSASSGQF